MTKERAFEFSREANAVEIQTASLQPTSLTSNQLEQWFASIERSNEADEYSDPYLANQFLARFGLKSAQQVILFLKSPDGKEALAVLAQELARAQLLNEQFMQQNQEEARRQQQRLMFLLMGLVFAREAQTKQMNEIIQMQIDKKLKENRQTAGTTKPDSNAISIAIMEQTIRHYEAAIKVLDEQLEETQNELQEVEAALEVMEQVGKEMEIRHTSINENVEQLDVILQNPLFGPSAQNSEQDFTQLLEQVVAKLNQHSNYVSRGQEEAEETAPFEPEVEGLLVQKRGLEDALHVVRKNKVLLNEHLEEVDNFEQAHFVVEPKKMVRDIKAGGTFAFIADNKDPKNLSEEEWEAARENFQRLRVKLLVPRLYFHEKIKQEKEAYTEHKDNQINLRGALINRINEIQANINEITTSKNELIESLSRAQAEATHTAAPTPFATIPKPTPKQTSDKDMLLHPQYQPPRPVNQSSYAYMMQNLARLASPTLAPRKEDISEVTAYIQKVVPIERQPEFRKLIEVVEPEKIMETSARVSWWKQAKDLMRDLRKGEPEEEPGIHRGFKGE